MIKRADPFKEYDAKFRFRVKLEHAPNKSIYAHSNIFVWMDERVGPRNYAITPVSWSGHFNNIAVHLDDASAVAELVEWFDRTKGEDENLRRKSLGAFDT